MARSSGDATNSVGRILKGSQRRRPFHSGDRLFSRPLAPVSLTKPILLAALRGKVMSRKRAYSPRETSTSWWFLAFTSVILLFLSVRELPGQAITAPALRGSLEQTVRRLHDCHIVAANRGNQDSLLDPHATKVLPVIFLDIWLSGDEAQFRLTPRGTSKRPWWDDTAFKPSSSPLTTTDIDSVPGIKVCLHQPELTSGRSHA